MTREERKQLFLIRCAGKYGDRFDYSKADFKNTKTPVIIIDTVEGKEFERIPELHLRYDDRNYFGNKKIIPKKYWIEHKEECYNESLKYVNKHSFQKGCSTAYYAAFEMRWLKEFFKGRERAKLYNNYEEKVHCVYVYEIKAHNTCYVGRTLRLNVRDKQHRNGVYRHGIPEYDELHKFCKENNIEMPQPIVLEENLNAPESQIKEDEYVERYRNDGWNVLNKAKTGIGVGSLGSVVKWNYEKCAEISKNCESKQDMRIKCPGAYHSSYINGWLDDFFISKKKPNRYWDIFENCQKEALKWKNVKEFSLKGGGAYNSSRKNGWLKDLRFKND